MIKQMFQMMDTDKNGNLNFQELKDGLYMFGQPVPDHDVQLLLDAVSIHTYIRIYIYIHYLMIYIHSLCFCLSEIICIYINLGRLIMMETGC